jgi:hypothetical protein
MAERNLAIRLSVVDGGKVKAELSDVGEAGEKSLKRIEACIATSLSRVTDRLQSGQRCFRANGRCHLASWAPWNGARKTWSRRFDRWSLHRCKLATACTS